MRIATLIISLVLMLVAGIQSCTVAVGGSVVEGLSTTAADKKEAEDLAGAGGIGVFAAFLWLVAAALVIAKPKASMWIFGVSALVWLIAGIAGSAEFTDAFIWAIASVIFAVMSYFGVKEKAKKDEQERARYQADIHSAVVAQQQPPPAA